MRNPSVALTLQPSSPFWAGFKDASPIAVSFLLSFTAVGVMSYGAGISLIQALSMTIFVFAGPAQYAVLSLFQRGEGITLILVSVAIINFRFLIMAMNLVRPFEGVPRRSVMAMLPMLSASTFSVTKSESSALHGAALFRYYVGVCLGSFPVAVLATGVGYSCSLGFSPQLVASVPMILPLYFAILLAKEWGKIAELASALLAFVLAPVLHLVLPTGLASLLSIVLPALFLLGALSKTEGEVSK